MESSLKTKLVISFLTVIIICSLIAALVGTRLIVTGIINQAQDNVKNDLNSAREIYQQETKRVKDVVRFTALRFFIKGAISSNDIETSACQSGIIRQKSNCGNSDIIKRRVGKRGSILSKSSAYKNHICPKSKNKQKS